MPQADRSADSPAAPKNALEERPFGRDQRLSSTNIAGGTELNRGYGIGGGVDHRYLVVVLAKSGWVFAT
jgi:hypothetical protein